MQTNKICINLAAGYIAINAAFLKYEEVDFGDILWINLKNEQILSNLYYFIDYQANLNKLNTTL